MCTFYDYSFKKHVAVFEKKKPLTFETLHSLFLCNSKKYLDSMTFLECLQKLLPTNTIKVSRLSQEIKKVEWSKLSDFQPPLYTILPGRLIAVRGNFVINSCIKPQKRQIYTVLVASPSLSQIQLKVLCKLFFPLPTWAVKPYTKCTSQRVCQRAINAP